jgi:hypothetical protein
MVNRGAWCEVDFPEDLEAARRYLSRWRPNVESVDVPASVGSAVSEKEEQRRGMERIVRPRTASRSRNNAPAFAGVAATAS